jgi:hypothetical protein
MLVNVEQGFNLDIPVKKKYFGDVIVKFPYR